MSQLLSSRPLRSVLPQRRVSGGDVAMALCDAALSQDRDAVADVVMAARDDGLTDIVLADVLLPRAVCSLGDLWREDHIGWTDVTIGTARLQAALRWLAPPIQPGDARCHDTKSVLLISCQDMAHTFGPMLLAHQIRRRGLSVALSLDTTPQSAHARFSDTASDAVFLTASHSDGVATLRQIVKQVRVFNSGVPIVVGGPLLSARADIGRLIGADIATSDLDEALTQCGLLRQPTGALTKP
ncbi:cobalamin-dependent protein [Loktanella sp. SALINAS62]|uniref:cobalamin B12-binding domain-containing protein n=1 Tax=Loktanella sp. SALINAS62 TaxID=2706124 RepID=UPI001B8AC86C|nr:cobalamin-dependent protein [Loktanella sp. SALINAS62]MBS1302296.1 cobalamin B12-binding domain-containing protein [Loktanella sp. SALINAS62]